MAKPKHRIPPQKKAGRSASKTVHPTIDSIKSPKTDKDNAFQVALDNKNYDLDPKKWLNTLPKDNKKSFANPSGSERWYRNH